MSYSFLKNYSNHYLPLIKLGLPIIVGQIGTIVLSFADTLMVGHHTTPELAAAAFVSGIINLFIIFGQGYSYGLSPIIGECFGARKYREAGASLRGSIVVNSLMSGGIVFFLMLIYANLGHMGQPDELMKYIGPFFLLQVISIPFVMLFFSFKQFADSITDTKISMWILLGGNLFNIVSNYFLIYGNFGAPELGLLGAGISTLVARILMLVVFALIFLKSKRYVRYLPGFYFEKVTHELLHKLNVLGWPIAMQMGMETAAFSLSTVMIGWLGTVSLAAHQVTLTISQICYMIYYGLGTAISVRVSYFKGMNDYKNVRDSTYCGFRLMMCLVVITSTIVIVFSHQLAALFTTSEDVQQMIGLLIYPLLIYQFGDGLQITFANALRGISVVKPMMYIAFVSYFLVSLPLGYFLGIVLHWGTLGVWMAFPFGLTTAGLLYYKAFHHYMHEQAQSVGGSNYHESGSIYDEGKVRKFVHTRNV